VPVAAAYLFLVRSMRLRIFTSAVMISCAIVACDSSNLRDRDGKHVVNAWLETQKAGRSGDDLWHDPSMAKSLFAVRSWTIVDSTCFTSDSLGLVKAASHTVRIDSSNKGGSPITVLWSIDVVRESKDADWKINGIFQR
jgi:hypothetical protein